MGQRVTLAMAGEKGSLPEARKATLSGSLSDQLEGHSASETQAHPRPLHHLLPELDLQPLNSVLFQNERGMQGPRCQGAPGLREESWGRDPAWQGQGSRP